MPAQVRRCVALKHVNLFNARYITREILLDAICGLFILSLHAVISCVVSIK